MTQDIQLFTNPEGEFLCGQALADAIKEHGILRFNEARSSRIAWQPDLRNADLSIGQSGSGQPGGIEGKMLRDPSEWKPPSAASLWKGDARYADLHNADLGGANLRAINLNNANLSGANCAEASLRGAQMRRADLSGVCFDAADLSGADLFEADMARVSLRMAKLHGANLYDAQVTAEALSQAALNETTILPDCEPYRAATSRWTAQIDAARAATAQDTPEPPVAVVKPDTVDAEGAEARPTRLAQLWAKLKALFGR